MIDILSRFVARNKKFSLILGGLGFFGGIILAIVTKDADPWGTIGGVICGLGLLLVSYSIVR